MILTTGVRQLLASLLVTAALSEFGCGGADSSQATKPAASAAQDRVGSQSTDIAEAMARHVPDVTPSADIKDFGAQNTQAIESLIDEIQAASFTSGANPNTWMLVLRTEFANRADVDSVKRYQARLSHVTDSVRHDWRDEMDRLLLYQQATPFEIMLRLITDESLFVADQWKSGEPEARLARLKSISREVVDDWYRAVMTAELEGVGDGHLKSVHWLAATDELFIDGKFQEQAFRGALSSVSELLKKHRASASIR